MEFLLEGLEYSKKKPTLKHRPAIWENILGTIFASDRKGNSEYFDYNYIEAREFAKLQKTRDIRVYPYDGRPIGIRKEHKPKIGHSVIWILD